MSIICAVSVPNAMILAADSRALATKGGKPCVVSDKVERIYTIGDPKNQLGMAYSGHLMENRFDELVETFEESDNAYRLTDKTVKFFRKKRLISNSIIAGFKEDGKPYIASLHWNGLDIAAVSMDNFHSVGDYLTRIKINRDKDDGCYYGCLWDGASKDVLTHLYLPFGIHGYYDEPSVDFNTMSVSTAERFAEFSVRTVIQYKGFLNELSNCGGEIHLLTLRYVDGATVASGKIVSA